MIKWTGPLGNLSQTNCCKAAGISRAHTVMYDQMSSAIISWRTTLDSTNNLVQLIDKPTKYDNSLLWRWWPCDHIPLKIFKKDLQPPPFPNFRFRWERERVKRSPIIQNNISSPPFGLFLPHFRFRSGREWYKRNHKNYDRNEIQMLTKT